MREMTTSEMLRDPLVRQMLRADRISLASFAALLDAAARNNVSRAGDDAHQKSSRSQTWNLDAAAFI